MQIWRTGNSLTRLLLTVLGVLVFVLILELAAMQFSGGNILQPDSAPPNSTHAQSAELVTIAGLETYQPTIDRSLFNWNRRPRITAVEEQGEEGELASRWRLIGVVNTGSETYAIFNQTDGTSQLRLGKGMYLEKWRIDEISSEQIFLSNDGEEQVFRLRETAAEAPLQDRKTDAAKRARRELTNSRQKTSTEADNKGNER